MNDIKSSTLHIRKLRLRVHLGCTPEEQHHPQPVDVDVVLRFNGIPKGSATDQLGETLCYAHLCEILKSTVENKYFKLLEKLSIDLYQALREDIPVETETWISVTKLHPPVQDLNGGVSFSFGDGVPPQNL